MECETKVAELKKLLSNNPFDWETFLVLDEHLNVISSPHFHCSFPWLLSQYPPQRVLHKLLIKYQHILTDDNQCRECLKAAIQYSNVEMIRYLSHYKGSALFSQPLDDSSLDLPLHLAGNIHVAQTLIDSFPQALALPNKEGNLPIHNAIAHFMTPEHVKLLVVEGKKNHIMDGHGGIHIKNHNGQTPLSILFHQVATGVDLAYLKFPLYKPDLRIWQNLNTLLEAQCTDDNGTLTHGQQFRILHELISSNCPYQAVYMGMMLVPEQIKEMDESGSYPLSLAARQKTCRKEILINLLNAYPDAIYRSDNKGRRPLHWASFSGRTLDEGIKELIDADPTALSLRDKDGSFPFMLAALSKCEASLYTIYYLLRQCPENISFK